MKYIKNAPGILDTLSLAEQKVNEVLPSECTNLRILCEFTGFPFKGLVSSDHYVYAILLVDDSFAASILDGIFGPEAEDFDDIPSHLLRLQKHLKYGPIKDKEQKSQYLFYVEKINALRNTIQPLNDHIETQALLNKKRLIESLKKIKPLEDKLIRKDFSNFIFETDISLDDIKNLFNYFVYFAGLIECWLRVFSIPHLRLSEQNRVKEYFLETKFFSFSNQLGLLYIKLKKYAGVELLKKIENIHTKNRNTLNYFIDKNNKLNKQLQLGVVLNFEWSLSLLDEYIRALAEKKEDIQVYEIEAKCLKLLTDDTPEKNLIFHSYALIFYAVMEIWLPALDSLDIFLIETNKLRTQKINLPLISGRLMMIIADAETLLRQALILKIQSPSCIISRVHKIKSEYAQAVHFYKTRLYSHYTEGQFSFLEEHSEGLSRLLSEARVLQKPPKVKSSHKSKLTPLSITTPKKLPEIKPAIMFDIKSESTPSQTIGTCFTPPQPTLRIPPEQQDEAYQARYRKYLKEKNKKNKEYEKKLEVKLEVKQEHKIYNLKHPFRDDDKAAIPAIFVPVEGMCLEIVRCCIAILGEKLIGLENDCVKPVFSSERNRYGIPEKYCLKIKGTQKEGEFKGQMFRVYGFWTSIEIEKDTKKSQQVVLFRDTPDKVHCGPQEITLRTK